MAVVILTSKRVSNMSSYDRRMTLGAGVSTQEIAAKKTNLTKNEKQILEKILEDNCKCSICLEVFKEPYELTCGHMYCFKCFEDWARQKRTTCPLCRQVISSSPVKCEAFAIFIADVMKACKPPNRSTRSVGNERIPASEKKAVLACKRPVWRY